MYIIYTIYRREISKIFTNKKKSIVFFLVPTIILFLVLTIFPYLMQYLNTGNIGRQHVIVCEVPESFLEFEDKMDLLFTYEYSSEFTFSNYDEKQLEDLLEEGNIIVDFGGAREIDNRDFDILVSEYYRNKELSQKEKKSNDVFSSKYSYNVCDIDINELQSYAMINLYYDNSLSETRENVEKFKQIVLENYKKYLLAINQEDDQFDDVEVKIDSFNPFTAILDSRTQANMMASNIVPGILMLFLYYCIYSLSVDMLAMERRRGFFTKLKVTPVPLWKFLCGKLFAIVTLAVSAALCVLGLIFFSSWINSGGVIKSLLPFGLFLYPKQLLFVILSMIFTAVFMVGYCFKVIADIDDYRNMNFNIQLPLLFLLVGLLVQFFVRKTGYCTLEWFIPIHNTLIFIGENFRLSANWLGFFIVIMTNLFFGLILLFLSARTLEVKGK